MSIITKNPNPTSRPKQNEKHSHDTGGYCKSQACGSLTWAAPLLPSPPNTEGFSPRKGGGRLPQMDSLRP